MEGSVSATSPALVIPSEAEGPAVSLPLATLGWKRWVLTQTLQPLPHPLKPAKTTPLPKETAGSQ
jgi:hypothetical protein